ncbi:MAG: exodeoxyribonuclease VII small subunit [Patescibacteria group bacterium]
MTTKNIAAKAKPDFGKSYHELEEIIAWFENEEIDLDEGLKKFERGLELAKICRSQLKDVENRVNELKVKFSELE